MVKPYLEQVGGKVKEDSNTFEGGLNVYQDKAFLADNEMPYVMNMTMTTLPELRTRNARTTIAKDFAGETYSTEIGTIIDVWSYTENQFYVITEIQNLIHLKLYYRQNGATGSYTIKDLILLPKEDKYYFTLARQATNDYLYVTGLTFKVKVAIDMSNPLTTIAEKIEDGHYGICCAHKGRLFLGMPESNIVTFSALYDYDNFGEATTYVLVENPLTSSQDADTNVVYITEADDFRYEKWKYENSAWASDGYIYKTEVTIDPYTMTSVPDYSIIAGDFKITNSIGRLVALKSYDDKLMVFCEHSMHTLYGDTPDITLQNQFQLVDLNNNLGAISDRCIAIGGGKLFWLGDNQEVYEYTGASINIISRPGKTRNSTLALGGISGLTYAMDIDVEAPDTGFSHSKFIATSERLYINIWNGKRGTPEKLLLVFDVYNRTWWCEDGEFTTIGNYSDYNNKILLARPNGDLLINNMSAQSNSDEPSKKVDYEYNFETNTIEEKPIHYEFHTCVYGVYGADLRKTIDKVWFQARADADVYITDMWTSSNAWGDSLLADTGYVKIGSLQYDIQPKTQPIQYNPGTYEQQVCYAPKMYGQRLNAFQIIVKGVGKSRFYLMKREWRAE